MNPIRSFARTFVRPNQVVGRVVISDPHPRLRCGCHNRCTCITNPPNVYSNLWVESKSDPLFIQKEQPHKHIFNM